VLCLAFTPDGATLLTGGSDTTVLEWDVARALKEGVSATAPLSDRELAGLWDQLAGKDGSKAFDAIARLAEAPHQGLPWLRDRVRPAPAFNAQKLAQLMADLEENRFELRKRATEELEKLGELAEPALRKRLGEDPPLEVRLRIDQLLERLAGPVTIPEQVRALRALEVLEQMGTPEALTVLRELAKGAPEARLTQDAQAAAERLAARKK